MLKFIVIFPLLKFVSSSSSYRLKSSESSQESRGSESQLLNKAFFQCDRLVTCTNVVQGTNNYEVVHSQAQLDMIIDKIAVWEKVPMEAFANIALRKPTNISSDFYSSSYNGSVMVPVAVDGKYDTETCAESSRNLHAWLRIDLERKALIHSIKVISLATGKRIMGSFALRVGDSAEDGGIGNPVCISSAEIGPSTDRLKVVCPNGMVGRYVTINTTGIDYIEVCEIEVYGYFIN